MQVWITCLFLEKKLNPANFRVLDRHSNQEAGADIPLLTCYWGDKFEFRKETIIYKVISTYKLHRNNFYYLRSAFLTKTQGRLYSVIQYNQYRITAIWSKAYNIQHDMIK